MGDVSRALGFTAVGFFAEPYIPLGSVYWLIIGLTAFAIGSFHSWRPHFESYTQDEQVALGVCVLVLFAFLAMSLSGSKSRDADSPEAFRNAPNYAYHEFDIDHSPPAYPMEIGNCREYVSRCLYLAYSGPTERKSNSADFVLSGIWGSFARNYRADALGFSLPLQEGCRQLVHLGKPLTFDSLELGDLWIEQNLPELEDSPPAMFEIRVLDDRRSATKIGVRVVEDKTGKSAGEVENLCESSRP